MKKIVSHLLVLGITLPLIACGRSGGNKSSNKSLLPTDIINCDPLPITDLSETIDVNLDEETIFDNSLGITKLQSESYLTEEDGALTYERYNYDFYNDEFVVAREFIGRNNQDDYLVTRVRGNIGEHCYDKYTLWNGCVDYRVDDPIEKDGNIRDIFLPDYEWDIEDIVGYKENDNFYYLVTSYVDSYTETYDGVEVEFETTLHKILEFTKDLKFSGYYYYSDMKSDHDYETLAPLPSKQTVYFAKRVDLATYGTKQDYQDKEEFYNSLPEVSNKNAILELNYQECELEDGNIKTLGEEKKVTSALPVSRVDETYSNGSINLKIPNGDSSKYVAVTGIRAGVQSMTVRGDKPGATAYSYYQFNDLTLLKTLIPSAEEKTKDGVNYLVINSATTIGLKLTFKAFSANAEPVLESK